VTYYPNVEEVTNNILQFIDCIDQLIIWQNTPLSDQENYRIKNFECNQKVIYMGEGKNMGIAYALNRAINMMNNTSNYTHLLAMDQDSTWINFKDYREAINCLPKHSIYSPNINNELQEDFELAKVKTCITSGALFPIDVLKIIGKFNEIYSVDCVDYDFSFKAGKHGVNIYKLPVCKMNQLYGEQLKSRCFNIETNRYSSKRLFFIARNHILLWKDYPDQIDAHFKIMILRSYIFGKIVKVILVEDNKVKKIASILYGFFCGIINDRRKRY
jgi:rhamnosyltransferase